MLIVTQREGETVEIRDPGGLIIGQVTTVRIQNGRARLGFQFPRAYAVNRMPRDRKKDVNRDGSPQGA
jgi:sRNA-binding carbon storage regulator CsrA